MMKRSPLSCLSILVLSAAASVLAVDVQRPGAAQRPAADVRNQMNAGDPCCAVLSVDAALGAVTAFEHASGNIFTFRVKDKALLSSIRPCQRFAASLAGATAGTAIAADFGGQVNSADPCCSIVAAPGAAGRVLGVKPHARFEGVTMILTELKRDGDLVSASCLYCNGGATRVDLASDLRARARGAKLLDTANQVQHEVLRVQGAGHLMSEHTGGSDKLAPNQSLRTWVRFSAPQASTVTLVLPGAAEPFESVPIGK